MAAGLAAAAIAAVVFGVTQLLPSDSQTPAGDTPTTSVTGSTGHRAPTTVRSHSGVPAAAVVPQSSAKKASKHPDRKHHGPSA
jgi:negative regulator of sigma E activity